MTRILILGGGFGGIEAFLTLHKLLHPVEKNDVRIELISRTNYFTYTPMLHEAATGSVAREHIVQPIREILSCCGQDFHQADVTSVDPVKKIVHTNNGPHLYDYLVVALGVEQGFFQTKGAPEHSLPLKWLPDAIAMRNHIIGCYEHASEMNDLDNHAAMEPYLHFVIVGGGATGTELAGQLADLARKELRSFYADVPAALTRLTLVHAGTRLLENLSLTASEKAKERLEKMGVTVLLNEVATEVSPQGVSLQSGKMLASKSVFWTAGTRGTMDSLFPAASVNERGLLKIDAAFAVSGMPDVFAIGDCTVITEPALRYPPSAQAAVQAAHVAAANLVHTLRKEPLTSRPFQPKGDIIPIGNWYAIYDKKSFHFTGVLAWWLRRSVFLYTMYSWSKRLKVMFDWTIQIFEPRDTSEF